MHQLYFKLFCCWLLIWPVQNYAKKTEKCVKPWHMGTHLKVLSQGYPMTTNMTGFRCVFF